jgi:hypothetical protein
MVDPEPLDGELALASHWVVELLNFFFESISRLGPTWGMVVLTLCIVIGMTLIITLIVQLRLGLHRIWWRKKYKPLGWTWKRYYKKHVHMEGG